jgi:uncharacterized protein (TIGR03067 family)
MKRLTAVLVVGVLVVGTSALGGDAKGDKELKGKWEVVTGKFLGKEVPLPQGGVHMEFEGDKVKFKEGLKPEEEGTFKVDTTKKPKEIDITPPKEPKMSGIYKIEGGSLTICIGLPDFKDKDAAPKRPSSFEEEKSFVFILKRAK